MGLFSFYQAITGHYIISFPLLYIAVAIMIAHVVVVPLIIFKNTSSYNLMGELVVLWSEISRIDVINVRPVQSLPDSNSRFVTFRDWRIITYDGREIIIPSVISPISKLRKVRKNLTCFYHDY